MNTRYSTRIALALVCLAVAACGSDQRTAGIDRGGVRAPVATEGPITGFGSIFVNDVRFDIDSAQITVNGVVVTQADLSIGQIVNVAGLVEDDGLNATADSVSFEANVLGPIEAIDSSAERITVLGQVVAADGATVFDLGADPAAFGSLAIDDIVEVSGFVGAGGVIVATRIERDAGAEFRVRGIATGVDTATRTFSINGLDLDYGSAFLIEDFPGGQPADGEDVIAVGRSFGPGGELLVEQLYLRDRLGSGSEGEEAEVEGLITRFVSPADFDVAGVPVMTNASTAYEDGDETDLMLNVKVQAEGEFDTNGVIVADKIEVKDGGRVY